jgi:hypothetical protein
LKNSQAIWNKRESLNGSSALVPRSITGKVAAVFLSSADPRSTIRFSNPAIRRISRKLIPAKRIPTNAATSRTARNTFLIEARPSLIIPAAMMPSTAGLST